MDQRESNPTETEYERHAPDGAEPGGGRPNTGTTLSETRDVDTDEREQVVGGAAATSEIADPAAQKHAERQGDGTPQPR